MPDVYCYPKAPAHVLHSLGTLPVLKLFPPVGVCVHINVCLYLYIYTEEVYILVCVYTQMINMVNVIS